MTTNLEGGGKGLSGPTTKKTTFFSASLAKFLKYGKSASRLAYFLEIWQFKSESNFLELRKSLNGTLHSEKY